jgi:hypothetical protein
MTGIKASGVGTEEYLAITNCLIISSYAYRQTPLDINDDSCSLQVTRRCIFSAHKYRAQLRGALEKFCSINCAYDWSVCPSPTRLSYALTYS